MAPSSIRIKRAYERPDAGDGLRILVDRVWPRGITKEKLKLYRWEKDIAPSTELRKWFGHEPAKWAEFKRKYHQELKVLKPEMAELRSLSKKHTVTLVYGAKDELRNQAVALKEFLCRGR
jgi:uncharacterized protein YeaO (DUF488 family)